MLDRALAKTFSELSTLVFAAFVLTVPLHLGHAYLFKDELSVREMGPEIAALEEGQRVRGVTAGDVDSERTWLAIVILGELVASVVVYRAARRVFSVADRGDVPGVLDAYKHVGEKGRGGRLSLAPIASLVAIGALAASVLCAIGTRIADMAPADLAWVGVGATRCVAMGLFLALAAGGTAALPTASEKPVPPAEKLDLY